MTRVARVPDILRPGPGQELWQAPAHRLAALVAAETRRGRVRPAGHRYEVAPGVHAQVVHRLRPAPPRWVGPVVVAAVMVVFAAIGAWLAYLALIALAQALWGIVGVLLLLWVASRILTGHRPHCAGLHCGGCGG